MISLNSCSPTVGQCPTNPKSVFDRPPFDHRFVGAWPDIRCVPITNTDGSDNIFGRNRAVTVDTIAVPNSIKLINRHIQMLSARSIGQKRQRESPGFDKNREFREWIANHGNVTDDLETGSSHSYTRVSFDDRNENYQDAEDVTTPAPIPTEVVVNSVWGTDGDDFPHPTTEHRERTTWRLAPSRVLVRPTEERYRVS